MLKHLTFWILCLLSFAVISGNINNISQQELLETDGKDLIIVDVRTAEEFQQGHVPNAINVPLSDIMQDTAILKSSKGKPIVLYCRSGKRAGKAANLLQKDGYQNIRHLEGDMLAWIEAGLTVER
ncbi:rhodanese-like domain-containing protein [uncultured Paraglaciecola sp.]|uniref:rhodanese-like domain-containing protein n=1 Tax=uncultured Paraglaciecola sp. TaxID=1765024 RepID=UPI0026208A9C|nr:rhodanese-like domain-containing protein [uncultured Paraglaciecola sp.]